MNKEQVSIARASLGRRLAAIRAQRGVSTYKMTEQTGLKFEVIKSIEAGSKAYTVDSLLKYCHCLGISLL